MFLKLNRKEDVFDYVEDCSELRAKILLCLNEADMRELLIDIDYPSCKASGFLSDDFERALKSSFRGSEYVLRIVFSASPDKAYFDSGYSRLCLSSELHGELAEIRQRISQVFKELIQKAGTNI